jgi:hypothetical protein
MEKNIRVAEELALEIWRLGAAAICPHANTRFFQDELPDHVWLDGDLEIVKRCDALMMTPDWQRSKGAIQEKTMAHEFGIPVFDNLLALEGWLRQ